MNQLISPIPTVLSTFLLMGCIMPPKGVEPPPIRSLNDIAAHAIKVNQKGYLPTQNKRAVLTVDTPTPVAWQLLDDNQKHVAKGRTTVFGNDTDSGEFLHHIDFSSVRESGGPYHLKADTATSRPFFISPRLYQSLERDALRYFYLNRSGIPLDMPFVEDATRKRKAGHMSDQRARCEPGRRCREKNRDVSGGWYDAGDWGKYVVNGGFSAWLLMHIDAYLHQREGHLATHPDLNIPETGNGIPDILNEARWEMEWLLKMQVTDGPEKGQAYHRIRNIQFTAMGHAPPVDNTDPPRYIQDTSTTATLNLAAAAALCAEVFAPYDEDFANRCKHAAIDAFQAAKRAPDVAATGTNFVPYQHPEATDDFYWAAAQLFHLTGDTTYLDFMKRSPWHDRFQEKAGGATSAFNWADTSSLGVITLATTSRTDTTPYRDQLVQFADTLIALNAKQGYRYPKAQHKYPWGSNSFVLNNAIVLAIAYDLTANTDYLEGVLDSMDYLLGRNPLDISYISGYGSNAMAHPHHRFFAPTYNEKLPFIPPGAVAGGPNNDSMDAVAKRHRAGCPPAKCYVDHVGSYATNEVAINWNAALAWIAVWINNTLP